MFARPVPETSAFSHPEPHAGEAFAALPYLGLLRFSGADALPFLQGQLSNDTRRLASGEPLLAAYSSPQGRVLAVLQLVPTAAGVLGVLPRDLVGPIHDRLRQFVLRAKVRIEILVGAGGAPEWSVAGAHAGTVVDAAVEAGTGGERARVTETAGVVIAPVVAGSGRRWLLGPHAAVEAYAARGGSPLKEDEFGWRRADIRAGLPQIYAATTDSFVAQMLNLDLIDGISFSKGCYTGQEIIARTQHLGRIKRRLYRLELPPGAWQVGAPVRMVDGRRGRLTDVVTTAAGAEALAVLPIEAGAADLDAADPVVADGAAQELPLPYAVPGG